MVDAADSKSAVRKDVGVRIPSPALQNAKRDDQQRREGANEP